MKRFLKIVIIFLIPLLILCVISEVMLRNISNRFQLQNDYILNHGPEIETLILGSSHSQFGINPEFLQSPSFNLSNKSQTLDLDLALLNHYQSSLPNLKRVVLRLSYTTLFEKLDSGNETWRLKDYEIYLDAESSNNLRHNFEILSVSPKENIRRFIDYYFKGEDTVNSTETGWGTELANKQPITNLKNSAIQTAKKHTAFDYRHFEENRRVLEELIEECATMNVDVFLVSMPTTRAYVNNLNLEQLNKTYKLGEFLQQKYDNCKYYYLMNNFRFSDLDFYDADHLNEQGAKKFSLLLNRLLEQ